MLNVRQLDIRGLKDNLKAYFYDINTNSLHNINLLLI
jgi:hypothetical protein